MYNEYEDGGRKRPRRRISVRLVCLAAAVLAFGIYRAGIGLKHPQTSSQTVKVQTVSIVDWRAVDDRVKRSLEQAHAKAERYAEVEVEAWIQELRARVDEDFLPWWFGYFQQQSVMLKAAGYWVLDTPLVEGLAGRQEPMEARLEALVEREFNARVLQPKSAQLRIEKIARKTIEVYLVEVQSELNKVQVEFKVGNQDWGRYLAGLPVTVTTLEANRQVGLVMKAVGVGGGAAALTLGRALTGRVRAMMARGVQRGFIEDGMRMGGRAVARNAGWWIAVGCFAWDLADHYRCVQQNLPVLRRSLGVFLDELQEQVLRDQRCGILVVLGEVQAGVLLEIEGGNP